MRLASFSHYPVSRPRHGGQRRVDAILRALRGAGHQVLHLPLYLPGSYPQTAAAERETALPEAAAARLRAPGRREDLHLAEALAPEAGLRQRLLDRLRAFAPDAVQFEQPWLYPLLAPLLAGDPLLARARLIYSSHNVESALIDAPWREEAAQVERALARAADLVVAVSAADAAVLSGWRGAGAVPVVVAPNGCWPPPDGIADVTAGGPAPSRPIAQDYALVTGSAHPPNARGYWACIGRIPGFLPPGTRLAVAGGMNALLGADPRFAQFRRLNEEFVLNLGEVDEERLTALLWHARAICLPVTEGGGTNLKTAEALMWLKPVVAMRAAMRGHDAALALSGVFVADTPQAFRHLLRRVMTGELGSQRRPQDVAHLGWPACLAPMLAAVAELAAQGPRPGRPQ